MTADRDQGSGRIRTPDPVLVQRITDHLMAGGGRKVGAELRFHCPAGTHADEHASCDWNEGKATYLCRSCGARGGAIDLVKLLGVELPERSSKTKGRIVAAYDYCAADGALLYQVVRYDPKDFRQRRPDPDNPDGWIWHLKDAKPVPYHLPELLAADPSAWVFIVEGEKDADALWTLGVPATTNAGGASKWVAALSTHLMDRRVCILPDNDPAGEAHAQGVAAKLGIIATDIRVLRLPGLPAKGDVSDWLASGSTAEQLLALADAAPVWEAPEPTVQDFDPLGRGGGGSTGGAFSGLPVVEVTARHTREITADAMAALQRWNEPPTIFQRGTELVRYRGGLTLEPLSQPALAGVLDRAADFVRVNQNGMQVPTRVPEHVVRDILSLPHTGVYGVSGVSAVPRVVGEGRVVAVEGYDPDTQLLFNLNGLAGVRWDLPIDEARGWLDEVLEDFPYADNVSRTHSVAAKLLPFVRDLIDGPTPLHHFDASTPGTGKGLEAEVTSIITTGGAAGVMSLVGDGDELEKRITSLLLAGHPLILLDNVNKLYQQALCAALTATTWRGRRLGKSETVTLPNTQLWVSTGNNVEFSDEMARRTVIIRLDAQVERPETRTGFRHPNLPRWVREHRTELVSAFLSIVRHWVDAGMPLGTQSLGTFEAWADVLGGILETAGYPDFLGNRRQLYESGDLESADWRALLRHWDATHGAARLTAGDVLGMVRECEVLLHLYTGTTSLGAQQRMGHALNGRRDRIYGGLQLKRGEPNSRNSSTYYLRAVGEPRPVGEPQNPENPETPILGTKQGPGFALETPANPAETPAKPRAEGQNPDKTRPDSRHENGVSGVSGVLNDTQDLPFVISTEPNGSEAVML